MLWRLALIVAAAILVAACTPRVQGLGPPTGDPAIAGSVFVTRDGVSLPLSSWLPEDTPKTVVLALHGFNMYRDYFEDFGPWLAARGIAVYAYDQRGFGAAPEPGIWGGGTAFRTDAADFLDRLKSRYPGSRLFLMGVSMGGAVAVETLAQPDPPALDGVILVAPALWGGDSFGPVARFALWFAAHTIPASTSTGSDLNRQASDNIEMLRALGRDPLIIKETRIDAIYGLTLLMGRGYGLANAVVPPKLVLFGRKDEIVPLATVAEAVSAMPANKRLAKYDEGWHMLLRDRQAETVWRDIATWIEDPARPLPSGAESKYLKD
jgi:acylglycerol lipase